ncbi:Protein of unknown function (DUF3098) [Chitinophaga dinghuensis]|uniref:DUF3098 family protein n=1 Tax=Chitinophaga dinghuensis TaxID=1539050 RepID=A0A327W8L5_9BACT|nr:DUF3098 domain-containing protein [Chitinophaga dinghuensis]RAJ85974.1 Protein of unknown function (DUF3098) [Chitinophaga dinghuensis]
MAKPIVKPTASKTAQPEEQVKMLDIFPKENYRIMLIGIIVIIVGFLLMLGGKSTDPNTFNANDVYSWRRITLAPIVIVGGLLIEVYAIMRRPKQQA